MPKGEIVKEITTTDFKLNERKKQLKRTIQNELNELEEKENEAYVEMARLQQSITP